MNLFKGHVEAGEDDFTTALREIREEAGLVQYIEFSKKKLATDLYVQIIPDTLRMIF